MKKTLKVIAFSLIVLSTLTMVSFLRVLANEWNEPQLLVTNPEDDHHPSIMQDSSGKIWVIWTRNMPNTPGNIWVKESSDGVSWSEERKLVDIFLPVGTSIMQDSTGRIWVAWSSGDYASYNWDIYYITSDDGGQSWSDITQLTDYPIEDEYPNLIEVSGEVWIVFRKGSSNSIYYTKTGDGGLSWSEPILLASGSAFEGCPRAMVDSTGKIWVVWHRAVSGQKQNIYYKTSTDNGASWSSDTELTNDAASEGSESIVEDVGCNKIFVFYTRFTDGPEAHILYKTTTDGGSTWSSPQVFIAEANLGSGAPAAALINNGIWVVWVSYRPPSQGADIWLSLSRACKVSAIVDFDPDTLNLKSNGQWITAYITLPEGYNVEDIVLETVYLDGIAVAWSEIQDGVYMAKFDRAAVQTHVTNEPDYDSAPKFFDITLTVTGQLADETLFEGSSTIRVISK